MFGIEVFLLTVASAVTASLVVALACLVYYRRVHSRPAQAYIYYHNGRRIVKRGLNGGVVRIGRHDDNEIKLRDHSVSRFHAQIVQNGNGSFAIRDLGSKNGVRSHFRPITYSVMSDGDALFVGNVPMKFVCQPSDYLSFPKTVQSNGLGPRHMMKRRRRGERFPIKHPVRFYSEATGWIKGLARDLSEEGMFIQTMNTLAKRTPVDIIIQKGSNGGWLKLSAEVVRPESQGMGVAFTDVDRETKVALYALGRSSQPAETATEDPLELVKPSEEKARA